MLRFFLIYIFLLVCFIRCADSAEKNMEDLSKVAREINDKCPKMLDSETRLDGIEVKEPNTLVYKYTLINLSAQNIDTVQFYRALWPGIISNIKVSPEMKKLKQNNTNIEYYYQDKTNKAIYTFRIGPLDYN